MEFWEYLEQLSKNYLDQKGDQRWGQYAFNFLHDVRPDIAHAIVGTASDPFYSDKLVPDFFVEVSNRW